MCKILEDMRNEAAREAAIKAAREASILTMIEDFREFGADDTAIKEKIMNKFNISAEEANEYMLGKSA